MSLIIMAFSLSKFLLQLRMSKASAPSARNDPFKSASSEFIKSLVTGRSLFKKRLASYKQELASTLHRARVCSPFLIDLKARETVTVNVFVTPLSSLSNLSTAVVSSAE